MAIEIVDFPIKYGDFNHSYVKLPEGRCGKTHGFPIREKSAANEVEFPPHFFHRENMMVEG